MPATMEWMEDNELGDAIRSLRSGLNESQQAFAYRMKTAIRTISRYETVQPPKGKALLQLADVARAAGRGDLTEIFHRHFYDEFAAFGDDIRKDAHIIMNRLYFALGGDVWLADQIRGYLATVRRDKRLIVPMLMELDDKPIDSGIIRRHWEHDLVSIRKRIGQSGEQIRETFAQEYAQDMGVTEDEAIRYTRSRFPELWPAGTPSTKPRTGESQPSPSEMSSSIVRPENME
jgi:transcriptional regulator with XRE-family HTH domain